MGELPRPTDLELAALISSKICHDVIGPVGAIVNGLEILEDDEGGEQRSYALDVIRNVTQQASARLQFARFAFGAAGSAGSSIDLGMAAGLAQGFVGQGKHKLSWKSFPGHMAKDKVKLLLNLVAAATTALPRGGDIEVVVSGGADQPTFTMSGRGTGARAPQYLGEFISVEQAPALDAMTIQAYYTWRLAGTAHMQLAIEQAPNGVALVARPRS